MPGFSANFDHQPGKAAGPITRDQEQ